MPDVTILLATFNGERYIREQLDSLAAQTYQDYRCYIHDDGSNDQTISICQEYCRQYPEHFVLLEYPGTGGAKNNFFSLMTHADGQYIFLCDQDDVWLPEKVEKMVNAVKDTKEDFLVFCDLKIVDEKLNTLSDSFYSATDVRPEEITYKNALVRGYIPGCAMMFSQGICRKALQYHNIEDIKMHDWWILLIALMTDTKMIAVNEPLVLYRQHEKNTVGAKELTAIGKIETNLKMLFSGTMKAEKKRRINSRRIQAKELYDCGIGTEQKRDFIKEFAEIGKKTKIKRILFYNNHFHQVKWIKWTLPWV